MSFTEGAALEALTHRAESIFGKLHEELHWDETNEQLVMRTTQDVEPILNANKELQVHGGDGYFGPERNWRRIASIPLGVVTKWLQEEGLNIARKDHWDYIVRRKLNDPEFSLFRTSPGKV